MPGLPSLVGRKPGNYTVSSVIRKGLEGSNPSPGALNRGSYSNFKSSQ